MSRGPRAALRAVPVWVLVAASLTLGLAPFTPRPHLVEKLSMLVAGDLTAPLDVVDLVLHATPWLLLVARLVVGPGPTRDADG